MNRRVVALIFAGVVTIFVSINAHASSDAFDGKGNLFVADAYSGRIFKYTPDGTKRIFASGLMPDGGYDVAFDRAGNLFVSDEANDLIFKFNPDGKKATFGTGLRARALIFDKAGNLFVPDYN
jgi:sugar lactone lactonase YvrE